MKKSRNKVLIIALIMAFLAVIVGTTYAFFSSSGGSANSAITVNATVLSNLGFTSANSKIATNLVPIKSQKAAFKYYPGTSASGCIDDVGNEICSVYEFTITNTASVVQTIYVDFVPSQNTFDNLYFAAFNTTAASAEYKVATGSSGSGNNFTLVPQTMANNSTLGHPATKLTKNSTAAINMPGLSVPVGVGESVTYTILVWLQDIGVEQNTEQGGIFRAGINVSTGANGNGVTAIMGARYPITTVYTANMNDNNYYYDDPRILHEKDIKIGLSIANEIVQYSTSEGAMTALKTASSGNYDYHFFLKHSLNSDIVLESYVGFVITPEMAVYTQGLTAGTYYLKGGDNGVSYANNVSILQSLFGDNQCEEYENSGETSFGCWASLTAASTTPSMHFSVSDTGEVDIGRTNSIGNGIGSCSINSYGISVCRING